MWTRFGIFLLMGYKLRLRDQFLKKNHLNFKNTQVLLLQCFGVMQVFFAQFCWDSCLLQMNHIFWIIKMFGLVLLSFALCFLGLDSCVLQMNHNLLNYKKVWCLVLCCVATRLSFFLTFVLFMFCMGVGCSNFWVVFVVFKF